MKMVDGGFSRFKDRMRERFSDSSPDEVYLTYHDTSLTYEDVHTLKDDWLTDNVIAFWEEYLEHDLLSKYDTRIILLRPSMSFLLFQTPDPHTLKSALPDFTNASHIFMPINDCRNVMEAEGGTHWSLLLVSLSDGLAFHYDSLPPGNATEANEVTAKISKLCDKPIKYVHMRDSPTQENSSDCGVFVCMTMRYLLRHRLLQANSAEYVTMALDGVPLHASTARKEMLQIIHRLKREGDRRRSYVTSHVTPIVPRSTVAPRSIITPHSRIAPVAPAAPTALKAPVASLEANYHSSRSSLFTCFFTCALFIVMIVVAISLYYPNVTESVYRGYSYTHTHTQRPVCRHYCEKFDSFLASTHSLLSPFIVQGQVQFQELFAHGKNYLTKACDAFAHLRRI